MPKQRDKDEFGNVRCARCGEFRDPKNFNKGDSYCKIPCRKAYSREYNLVRGSSDNKYLPVKAAKARMAYRTDPMARARRLEASAKWRSGQKNAEAVAQQKPGAMPGGGRKPMSPRVAPSEIVEPTKKEIKEQTTKKWSDL